MCIPQMEIQFRSKAAHLGELTVPPSKGTSPSCPPFPPDGGLIPLWKSSAWDSCLERPSGTGLSVFTTGLSAQVQPGGNSGFHTEVTYYNRN